jgi:hypothetical protein
MHKSNANRLITALFILIVSACLSIGANAQRVSEKNVAVIAGQSGVVIDNLGNTNLTVNGFNLYGNTQFTVVYISSSGEVKVNANANISGIKKATAEYEVTNNGITTTNYRVYNINFVKSLVKANDDVLLWDGIGTLDIDVKANDEFTSPTTLKINQASGSAAVINGKIQYSNANFVGPDYIHYSITDNIGTTDQAIVKIEKSVNVPSEDLYHNFVVNYTGSKLFSLPAGFTSVQDPFNGNVATLGGNNFRYTPDDYYIGLDSFKFENTDGIKINYNVSVIDAQRDPGIVKNDIFYVPLNTSITFDVLKNDLIQNIQIDTFSQQLYHESLGVFTVNPISGSKNYFYEVTTPIGKETGKIKVKADNFNPDRDIKYNIDMLGNVPFVIEYEVPIAGYGFTVQNAPSHGVVNIYTDSTSAMSCGTAYGTSIITYTPDNGFTGADEFSLNYCINGAQCKVIKIYPNIIANPNNICNCVENCVWTGDLNGDGRVSGQDLLVLGRYMGAQGPTRSSNNQSFWTGESATEWGINTTAGRDLMHADADGDGSLTEADAQSISDNFTKVNSLVIKENLGYKDFPFTVIPVPETVDSGEVQTIYFVLGDENIPANGVHGISFGVNVPNVDSASVVVDMYKNSFLTENAPSLSLWKQVKKGDVRIAVTRAEGAGIIGEDADGFKIGGSSGNGIIGQMSIIGEDADGFRESGNYYTRSFEINNILLEDNQGEKFDLKDVSITLKQNKKKKSNSVSKIYLFPNPASDKVDLLGEEIKSYEIYNANGKKLTQKFVNDNFTSIITKDLSNGFYFVKIQTLNGSEVRKILISH